MQKRPLTSVVKTHTDTNLTQKPLAIATPKVTQASASKKEEVKAIPPKPMGKALPIKTASNITTTSSNIIKPDIKNKEQSKQQQTSTTIHNNSNNTPFKDESTMSTSIGKLSATLTIEDEVKLFKNQRTKLFQWFYSNMRVR